MNDYSTVTFPKALIKEIKKLIEEVGYWPSVASFVREASIARLFEARKHRDILARADVYGAKKE